MGALSTEEDVGYQDAMRQVQRSIARRLKNLEEQFKDAEPDDKAILQARMDELHHMEHVLESLHR